MFTNRSLRFILVIWWRRITSNLGLEEKLCQWMGQALRREDENIWRMAFEWNPYGTTRHRGRLRITLDDSCTWENVN